jgi:catechol 2,3-dioxygenase-like lactoylglutathione lyase family enzyme
VPLAFLVVGMLNLERWRPLAASLKELPVKVNDGIHWIIDCTPEFDRTVAFFRDIMGLRLAEEGIPVTDTQFARYALLRLPDGGTLEIVEPADEAVGTLYAAPVITFKVDDLAQARRELSGNGVEFVAPIFQVQERVAWTYFRAPDGHVYQIWSDAMSEELGATSTQQ